MGGATPRVSDVSHLLASIPCNLILDLDTMQTVCFDILQYQRGTPKFTKDSSAHQELMKARLANGRCERFCLMETIPQNLSLSQKHMPIARDGAYTKKKDLQHLIRLQKKHRTCKKQKHIPTNRPSSSNHLIVCLDQGCKIFSPFGPRHSDAAKAKRFKFSFKS